MSYKLSDIKNIINLNNSYMLTWYITEWCNFKCWYCIQGEHTQPWIPQEDRVQMAKKINQFLQNQKIDKPIKLKLMGGEITYYNLEEIIDQFDNIFQVDFITNFSRDLEYFKSLYTYCADRGIRLKVYYSEHPENESYYLQKFLELFNWCKSKGYAVPVNKFVIDNDFDLSKIQYLLDNGVTDIQYDVRRVSETNTAVELNDNIKEVLLKLSSRKPSAVKGCRVDFLDGSSEYFASPLTFVGLLEDKGFYPDNFMCDIGTKGITIMPNGNVIRGRCGYNRSSEDHILGNILTNIDLKITTRECRLNENNKMKNSCSLCTGASVFRKED